MVAVKEEKFNPELWENPAFRSFPDPKLNDIVPLNPSVPLVSTVPDVMNEVIAPNGIEAPVPVPEERGHSGVRPARAYDFIRMPGRPSSTTVQNGGPAAKGLALDVLLKPKRLYRCKLVPATRMPGRDRLMRRRRMQYRRH